MSTTTKSNQKSKRILDKRIDGSPPSFYRGVKIGNMIDKETVCLAPSPPLSSYLTIFFIARL